MFTALRKLIERETGLAVPAAHLTPRANLYELGLTSFDAIRLLLAVERAFGVEFPRESLKRESMATMEAIALAVGKRRAAPREASGLQRAA
ncbi:MAG: phosphopantetheine-binding protein [Methylocystis sp.]|uniref:phosphopantetheine-binding protein n=1 Tax=Methylocystis sp. TaxID=1911079 RepID=UPI003DA2478C